MKCPSVTSSGKRCKLKCCSNMKTCYVHATDCSICLEKNNKSRTLKCGHSFHDSCIDTWLSNHDTCPCCRVIIKETLKFNIKFYGDDVDLDVLSSLFVNLKSGYYNVYCYRNRITIFDDMSIIVGCHSVT